ncbi:hypothetical protein [Vulgatibacter sp.]|uniref:hypothetical protein n=1 Tax=Vulgatibacter sp. TaxID=1971226 RepID=UPI003565791E
MRARHQLLTIVGAVTLLGAHAVRTAEHGLLARAAQAQDEAATELPYDGLNVPDPDVAEEAEEAAGAAAAEDVAAAEAEAEAAEEARAAAEEEAAAATDDAPRGAELVGDRLVLEGDDEPAPEAGAEAEIAAQAAAPADPTADLLDVPALGEEADAAAQAEAAAAAAAEAPSPVDEAEAAAAAEAAADAEAEAAAEGVPAEELAAEAPPGAEAPPLATEQPIEGEPALAAEPPPPTPEQQQALEEQAAAEERARQLGDLVGAVNTLNENQQLLDERTQDLEDEIADIEDQGTAIEEARVARIAAYSRLLEQAEDLDAFLATGGGTGADAGFAQLAQSLGQLAGNAYQTAGEREAAQAIAAQEALVEARASLAQADIWGARSFLNGATLAIRMALGEAQSTPMPLFRQ